MLVCAPVSEQTWSVTVIKQVKAPLLIVHGTDDRVIPFFMGKELFDAARTRKQLIKIERAGHNDLQDRYEQFYWPPMADFINNLDWPLYRS